MVHSTALNGVINFYPSMFWWEEHFRNDAPYLWCVSEVVFSICLSAIEPTHCQSSEILYYKNQNTKTERSMTLLQNKKGKEKIRREDIGSAVIWYTKRYLNTYFRSSQRGHMQCCSPKSKCDEISMYKRSDMLEIWKGILTQGQLVLQINDNLR